MTVGIRVKRTAKSRKSTKKSVSTNKNELPHDHTSQLNRLKRIKGQVDGVERMIRERRYCPEIAQQIKATRSALRSLECLIVEGHLQHCVKQAIHSKDPAVVQTKLNEILQLIKAQG